MINAVNAETILNIGFFIKCERCNLFCYSFRYHINRLIVFKKNFDLFAEKNRIDNINLKILNLRQTYKFL